MWYNKERYGNFMTFKITSHSHYIALFRESKKKEEKRRKKPPQKLCPGETPWIVVAGTFDMHKFDERRAIFKKHQILILFCFALLGGREQGAFNFD